MANVVKNGNNLVKTSKFYSYLKTLKDDTIANITRPILPLPLLNIKPKYIPLSATTLVRLIGEDSNFCKSPEDQGNINTLSNYLYQSICKQFNQRYIDARDIAKNIHKGEDKVVNTSNLDNDYWLLQKISDLANSANLLELPEQYITTAFSHACKINDKAICVKVDPKAFDILRIWVTIPPINGIWGSTRKSLLSHAKFYVTKALKPFGSHVESTESTAKVTGPEQLTPLKPPFIHQLLVVHRKSPSHPLRFVLIPSSTAAVGLVSSLSTGARFEPGFGRKILAGALALSTCAGLTSNLFSQLIHVPVYANDVLSFLAGSAAFKVWRVDTLKRALDYMTFDVSTYGRFDETTALVKLAKMAARESFCQTILVYVTLLMVQSTSFPGGLPPGRLDELGEENEWVTPGYLEVCVEKYVNHLLKLVPNTPREDLSIEFDSRDSLDRLLREGLVDVDETNDVRFRALDLNRALNVLTERNRVRVTCADQLGENPFPWLESDDHST